MKLALGLYGLYLLLVAIKGNGSKFVEQLQTDAPAFLPWLIAAAVLGALYEYDKTRTFAGAFLLLAVITFVTKNFAQLKSQFSGIYSASLQPASQTATAPTPLTPISALVGTTPAPSSGVATLVGPSSSAGQQ